MTTPITIRRFTGNAAHLPSDEQHVILAMADAFGVPATLLAAIRLAENGREARAFGILSIPDCDTYGAQCRACAETIKNNLGRFTNATKASPWSADGTLSDAYLAFLQSRYAPMGAANDPGNLNSSWLTNVTRVYRTSGVEVLR